MRSSSFLDSTKCLLITATLTTAHMQLYHPPPFNSTNNPHRTTPADPYLQYPYDCCGPHDRWTYPCRGYLSLLGTDQGAPTATWEAGSAQNWTIYGIGNHYGGSCQVGFLDDEGSGGEGGKGGKSAADGEEAMEVFKVATSYEGNCPHRNAGKGPDGQSFHFTVPKDLKPGVRVFAWIWYNREQEFNMNCAAVNITAAAGGASASPAAGGSGGKQAGKADPDRIRASSSSRERKPQSERSVSTTYTTTWTTTSTTLSWGEGKSKHDSTSTTTTTVHRSSEKRLTTSTTWTTIHETSTRLSTTTVTPSRRAGGKVHRSNVSPEAASALSSSSTRRGQFGESFGISSDSRTTTVYTTISGAFSGGMASSMTGLSAQASRNPATGSKMGSSDPSVSMMTLSSPAPPPSSISREKTTTVYTTIIATPSAALTSAPASHAPPSIGEASVGNSASALPRSGFSIPVSNNSSSSSNYNIVYTSTTTTILRVITTTVGGGASPPPNSSTPNAPLFRPAAASVEAANDTQPKLQTLRTANNCSCTCPAGDSPKIEDCDCFCYQPLSHVSPSPNSTKLAGPDVDLTETDPTHQNGENMHIARPDDHISVHPRNFPNPFSSSSFGRFVPFHCRPKMFIADDGNGCRTPKTHWELKYPHPGPDIVPGDGVYPLMLPSGNCSQQPGEQEYHGGTGEDGHS